MGALPDGEPPDGANPRWVHSRMGSSRGASGSPRPRSAVVSLRLALGRDDEGHNVLALLEARPVDGRRVLRPEGADPDTKPGAAVRHVRLDDIGLVPARAKLIGERLRLALGVEARDLQ